jgi:hypothetical protein
LTNTTALLFNMIDVALYLYGQLRLTATLGARLVEFYLWVLLEYFRLLPIYDALLRSPNAIVHINVCFYQENINQEESQAKKHCICSFWPWYGYSSYGLRYGRRGWWGLRTRMSFNDHYSWYIILKNNYSLHSKFEKIFISAPATS